MKALIAFSGRPNSGFLDTLVQLAKGDGIVISGAYLCPGPGCWNLAIIVESDDAENFVNQLTMALMPAKWELCNDPKLEAGKFTTEAE